MTHEDASIAPADSLGLDDDDLGGPAPSDEELDHGPPADELEDLTLLEQAGTPEDQIVHAGAPGESPA